MALSATVLLVAAVLPLVIGFNHEADPGDMSCAYVPDFSKLGQSAAKISPFDHF